MKTLRKLLLLAVVALALCTAALASDNYDVASKAEFYQVLDQALTDRTENFTVTYDGDYEALVYSAKRPDLAQALRDMAASLDNSTGSGADYNALNIADAQCGVMNDVLYLNFTYLTTQAEEAALDAQCAAVVAGLDLNGQSDFVKLRELYEYVGTNYVYDDSLSIFSAYEGLQTGSMVCQGYALLMYKLLWQADVECRIITGESHGESHGWNLVKLHGRWYNLDVTWDAAETAGEGMHFAYFLKSTAEFADHTRNSAYLAPAFERLCPMAASSYACPAVTLSVEGDALQALLIRKGVSVTLSASATGARGGSYAFSSTNPAVAAVDESGTLTSMSPGSCTVIVRSDDRSVLPAMLPVTAVDLTQAGTWAQEAVNAYYLRSLLPAAFCTGFDQPVTRIEMARLLYLLLSGQQALPKPEELTTFSDLSSAADTYYANVLCAAGILSGTGDGKFSPNALLTREQAAKLLVKAAEFLTGEALPTDAQTAYSDAAAISVWAQDYVSAATAAKLLQGANGSFLPTAQMTREHVIVALERVAAYRIFSPFSTASTSVSP